MLPREIFGQRKPTANRKHRRAKSLLILNYRDIQFGAIRANQANFVVYYCVQPQEALPMELGWEDIVIDKHAVRADAADLMEESAHGHQDFGIQCCPGVKAGRTSRC